MNGQDDERRLEDLRRRLREPLAAVWQDACGELAALSLRCFAANEEIRRLLQCPYGELRLRGVLALSHLAPHQPGDVRNLLVGCLSEPDVGRDPVFADALLALLSRLPTDVACRLLADVVDDSRETVRAAAAASLAGWRGWPGEFLLDLATDPSALVRCSVALSLASLQDVKEAGEAMELVLSSPESFVRAYAAELMNASSTRSEQPPEGLGGRHGTGGVHAVAETDLLSSAPSGTLLSGAERLDTSVVAARLARLLDEPECRVRLVINAEELFCDHPQDVLELVYPLLDHAELPSLLDHVAWLARDPRVARVVRCLHGFLCGELQSGPQRLLTLQQALEGQQGAHAAGFRCWLAECVRGAKAASLEEVVVWTRCVDAHRYAPLVELASAFDGSWGVVGLHEALGQMEHTVGRIDEEFPLPERRLVRMLLESWIEVLDEALQEQLSEVNS